MKGTINPNHLLELLETGIRALDLSIDQDIAKKLVSYIELLNKWSAVYNLTAVRAPEEMVTRHLLDSLVVCRFFKQDFPLRVIDVGTGAGLPGLVLAICRPNVSFVLLDSQQKKINFVQQAALSLGVKNVSLVCERVERYQPAQAFDWVISRAFASLGSFIEQTAHLAEGQGRWIAMKGNIAAEELAALPQHYTIEDCLPVEIPGLSAHRCLVFVKRETKGDSSD